MIADGDSAARNAFRVALLTAAPNETPLPVNVTQELDPSDILEVRDMAEAIARTEQIVAAPRSSRPSRRHAQSSDMFETLGRRATDDTAGPATPAPLTISTPPTAMLLLRPASVPPGPGPVAAAATVLSIPAVAPVTEDDAYFHPVGRMRALNAEATLDGYRPEPTLLLRARARRKSFSWILGAILLPVMVLAAIAILGRQDTATAATPTSTTTIATATIIVKAPVTAAPATPTAAPPVTAVTAVTKPAVQTREPGSVPVFDVNSLPTAGSRPKPRSAR